MKTKYFFIGFLTLLLGLTAVFINTNIVKAETNAQFALGNVVINNPVIGAEFVVNVHATTSSYLIHSLDLGINFDKNTFEITDVEWNLDNWLMAFNPNSFSYSLAIGAASAYGFTGDTSIATIKMKIKSLPTQTTEYPLVWSRLDVDEGNIPSIGNNGSVTLNVPVVPPTPTPISIQITSPNGGETLTVGDIYRIKWNNSANIDKVSLGYKSCDSCLDWINGAYNIANTGYFDWTVAVGNTTNTQFKIYAIGYYTGYGSTIDTSDNTFTVLRPVVPTPTPTPIPTPTSVPTPIPTPVPTPIPTPTPIPICSLDSYQTTYSGTGTALTNTFNQNQYRVIIPTQTGEVSKVAISAYYLSVNYTQTAIGWKELQCKITDNNGINLTNAISNVNNGIFTRTGGWYNLNFASPVQLTANTNYRLYCRVENKAGGGYLYWRQSGNQTSDKTYKLYLCR